MTALSTDLTNRAWAMEPRSLEALLSRERVLEEPGAMEPLAAVTTRLSIQGTVGVIAVEGVLMKRPPRWLSWYGIQATDYEEIGRALDEARTDGRASQIVLHINSPGGEVAGATEAIEAVRRAAAQKPVRAFIEDLGASAAYYLAAQASEVIASPLAMVGSIGVYSVWVDSSKGAQDRGLKVHVVRSGALKGMGIAGAPITEPQLEAMKEVIDGMAAGFVEGVARGRRAAAGQISELSTGRLWLAPRARELGLIDRTERLSVFRRQLSGASAREAAVIEQAKKETREQVLIEQAIREGVREAMLERLSAEDAGRQSVRNELLEAWDEARAGGRRWQRRR